MVCEGARFIQKNRIALTVTRLMFSERFFRCGLIDGRTSVDDPVPTFGRRLVLSPKRLLPYLSFFKATGTAPRCGVVPPQISASTISPKRLVVEFVMHSLSENLSEQIVVRSDVFLQSGPCLQAARIEITVQVAEIDASN